MGNQQIDFLIKSIEFLQPYPKRKLGLKGRRFKSLDKLKPKPGDVLEFDRGYYSHYALYLGNGRVMNICAESKRNTEALIADMSLKEVCGSSPVRVSNHDRIARKYFVKQPQSIYKITEAARLHQNKSLPYEFHWRNCEYYSTLWRFGKGFSTQVANYIPIAQSRFTTNFENRRFAVGYRLRLGRKTTVYEFYRNMEEVSFVFYRSVVFG